MSQRRGYELQPTRKGYTTALLALLLFEGPAIRAETFRDCDFCPLMTVLPPGTFLMGGREGDEGYTILESPLHTVTIAKPFAVGIYESTFREWRECVKDGACSQYDATDWTSDSDHSTGKRKTEPRDDFPAVGLQWADARKYIEWLNAKTSNRLGFRMLSEAEWEYAARAGTTTPFYFGETISTDQANFDGTLPYGASPRGVRLDDRVPVGSLPPNAFGLYEMHGNVREWVDDCWHDNYVGAPVDGSAWLKPPGGRRKCALSVVRGGSFDDTPRALRSSFRYPARSSSGTYHVGLRLARDVRPFEPGIPSLPALYPVAVPTTDQQPPPLSR